MKTKTLKTKNPTIPPEVKAPPKCQALLGPLKQALRSAEMLTKNCSPRFRAVRLRTVEGSLGSLSLEACDGETELATILKDSVCDVTFDAVVDIKELNAALQGKKTECLMLSVSDGALTIRSATTKQSVTLIADPPALKLPVVAEAPLCKIQIPREALNRLISWTVPIVARESSRYAITVPQLIVEGNKLTVVATDGRRMSVGTEQIKRCDDPPGKGTTAIIPPRPFTCFLAAPHSIDPTVTLTFYKTCFEIGGECAFVRTCPVDGGFPKYQDAIPFSWKKSATLDRKALLSAVRGAPNEPETQTLRFSVRPDKLVISRTDRYEVDVLMLESAGLSADKFDIGLSRYFMLDVLPLISAVISDDARVTLWFNGPDSAVTIRLRDDNYIHILMPVDLRAN